MIADQCGSAVILDNKLYQHWFEKGWNKEDVDHAINDLADRKIINVSTFQNGEIIMGLIEPIDLHRFDGGDL
jgi:hypothetical protein